MRVLSWDIGVRNLAVCWMEGDQILHWETIDIYQLSPDNFRTKTDRRNLDKIIDTIYDYLDDHMEWMDSDYVLIENQPALRNPIMKTIQCAIYDYYKVMRRVNEMGPISINYRATEKLKQHDMPLEYIDNDDIKKTKRQAYRLRKDKGVELSEYYLRQNKDEINLEYLLSQVKSKRDDLADAYLQGRSWVFKNRE